MTTGIAPCIKCKHFIKPFTCKAFKVIPSEIAKGMNNHTQPYKGDNGIQFEPIEKKEGNG